MFKQRPLRRAVIKEELVVLTGDFMEALVLNQFLYWTQRSHDYELLLQEERMQSQAEASVACGEPEHGWIYKKAEELNEELMLGRSPSTIRRVIVRLVNKGWLRERNNPRCAWDKTKQYRVNLLRLKNDLAELGYPLQGYELSTAACGQVSPKLDCEAPGADSQVQAASSDAPTAASHQQNDGSTWRDAAAIPEITAEITTEITRKNTNKNKEEEPPAGGGRVSAGVDLLVVEPDAGKERQKTESGETYSPEFEAFWQVYPKQRNKWQAWRQWQRALKRQRPRPVVAAELIAAAQNYALRSILQEPRFIMFPATFLGPDCRYLDYLDTPWPEANGNNVPAELSPEAASALVELINQAPEALRDKTTVHVRYRLLQSGFDLAYGEAGQYVLWAD